MKYTSCYLQKQLPPWAVLWPTSGSLWPATRAPSSWSLVKGADLVRWAGDLTGRYWKTGGLWMIKTKRLMANLSTFCPSCFESDVFNSDLMIRDKCGQDFPHLLSGMILSTYPNCSWNQIWHGKKSASSPLGATYQHQWRVVELNVWESKWSMNENVKLENNSSFVQRKMVLYHQHIINNFSRKESVRSILECSTWFTYNNKKRWWAT